MKMRILLKVALLAVLPLFLLGSSKQAEAGLFKISRADEIRIGKDFYKNFSKDKKYLDNTKEGARVKLIGQRLVQKGGLTDYDYVFTLVDDEEVNAFAVPGGYVFINKGLYDYLAYDEGMLAAVLAHEIGHITERHFKKMYDDITKAQLGILIVGAVIGGEKGAKVMEALSVGGNLIFLKYSRDDEEHADAWGVKLAYKAGYDPYAMSRALRLFVKLEGVLGKLELFDLLRTHPNPSARVERTQRLAREISGRDEWEYHPPRAPEGHPLHEQEVRIIKLDQTEEKKPEQETTEESSSDSSDENKGKG